ncbi:MAG: phosphoglucomutase/phosphomannomutase family protein [Candidatus Omnitrophica bacterium]|nr:phosphoglucomutase/phosphomannomutase family protein [Candidatus Omnitrophota bacterium]
MSIVFGTEGWRAVIAEEFTAENVRIVTQAIAEHLLERHGTGLDGKPLVVAVGYDTRFLSDYFAKAICEVLAANRIHSVLSATSVPTCAVSRYVVAKSMPLGIMVTASHNPAIYNGIKVKESYGGSATTETVSSIEQRLSRSSVKQVSFSAATREGAIRTTELLPEYLKGIRSFVDLSAIRRMPFRVVVDSMHGAGGRIIEELLAKGRCRIETLHAQPDCRFGGQAPEPIASHLQELSQRVRQTHADVGIANDGDADRIGMIAQDGTWLNPGQLLCILLLHLVQTRQAKGMVVKTVSNTMMINRLTAELGLKLVEVPVGFKHIAKLMLQEKVLIGGEESGGIGITEYLPERDGVFNGLLLLEALAVRKKRLSFILQELEKKFGQWHYGRKDLHLEKQQVEGLFARLSANPPQQMAGISVARIDTLDGVKLIGKDESWLLFRRSGTEPIVRIYAESPKRPLLSKFLTFGVRLATAP